ncbi:MAG TPA: tetratricopeptide repeat protein [Candidatus Sulfopaludibacter sp.]|nr:tetratricopeptide repeat protein [Candidatus Sulfopaludibacter sp.]
MWPLVAALLLFQGPDFSADGLKALEAGKYDAAAQAFQKAIEADPKDYFAHFNLALAYSLLHKDAESVAEYRKTLELKPKLFEAELNAGIVLLRLKNPAEALPLLEDAAPQKPREFRPRYYLAEAQLQAGDAVKAEESFRAALELNPKSAAAELGMAHALARQARLADAAPHFRQAASLDATYRDSLLELADLYEKDHQTAEALAIYREFPDNVAVREHVGALMLENKQYADAIPPLEQAYARDPTPANRAALAMAYLSNGDRAKALPLLDQAVAADPSNFELRTAYAHALRDEKKYQPAAAQFYAASKLKPNDLSSWNGLASMLYLTGDYPQALAAFDKARQIGGETAGNCFMRAIMLDKMKQLKPALAAYQEFLALDKGKNPDQEWQAQQRAKLLQREIDGR